VLVSGEGDLATSLMRPQLRQSELKQRQPTFAASVISDERD